MARKWKKKDIKFYDYECSLTGEKFRLNREAKNPGELISVKAYYELYPEKDDRPEVIKKKIGADEITQASYMNVETEEEEKVEQSVEDSPDQGLPGNATAEDTN